MAVAKVINSDDFRVEYMSAVARYMEDEEEKEELRADIEKKQERIESLEAENESLKAEIASLRNKQENG